MNLWPNYQNEDLAILEMYLVAEDLGQCVGQKWDKEWDPGAPHHVRFGTREKKPTNVTEKSQ